MSLPAEYDIEHYAGDDFTMNLTFTDSEGAEVDLSGHTFRAQIRVSRSSSAALVAEMSVDDSDAATGLLVLSMDSDVTAEFTDKKRWVWDVEMYTTADPPVVTTLVTGKFTVTGQVSREEA